MRKVFLDKFSSYSLFSPISHCSIYLLCLGMICWLYLCIIEFISNMFVCWMHVCTREFILNPLIAMFVCELVVWLFISHFFGFGIICWLDVCVIKFILNLLISMFVSEVDAGMSILFYFFCFFGWYQNKLISFQLYILKYFWCKFTRYSLFSLISHCSSFFFVMLWCYLLTTLCTRGFILNLLIDVCVCDLDVCLFIFHFFCCVWE